MSDNLIQRFSIDFRMMRTYDDPTGPFVRFYAHAQAISEARAEIERLTEQARRDREYSASQAGEHVKLVNRILIAESEISTLRARVREVVGPFAKAGELFGPRLSDEYDQCIYSPAAGDEYSLCGDHLRAARQLMEDLK